jgi:hydrogenase maturation protease
MNPQAGPELLVVGYGNTLRGDDGVGPRVANAIAGLGLPGVQTLACDLLAPELAEAVSHARVVVFVDASIEGLPEAQLRAIAPAESSQLMAHAADPRTVLALARDVFGRAPQSWWLTIPIEQTRIGETFSAFAQQGFEAAVEKLKALAAQIIGNGPGGV